MPITREEIEAYRERFARFNEWEKTHPPPDRDAAHLIADLGAILDWIPVETRLTDPDPQKIGIGKMIAALRHLRGNND